MLWTNDNDAFLSSHALSCDVNLALGLAMVQKVPWSPWLMVCGDRLVGECQPLLILVELFAAFNTTGQDVYLESPQSWHGRGGDLCCSGFPHSSQTDPRGWCWEITAPRSAMPYGLLQGSIISNAIQHLPETTGDLGCGSITMLMIHTWISLYPQIPRGQCKPWIWRR